jgi:ribonuclease E
MSPFAVPGADQPELQPVYAGPTPADPFGGRAFDIFDVMDQAERAAEVRPAPRAAAEAEGAEPGVLVGNTKADVEHPEPAEITQASEVVRHEAEIANLAAPEPVGTVIAAEPGGDQAGAAATEPSTAIAEAVTSDVFATEVRAGESSPEPEVPKPGMPEPGVPEPGETRTEATISAQVPEAPVSQAPAQETPARATGASDPVTNKMVQEPGPSEPLIKPVLVGAEAEPTEKKRGWWRR